jgi:hypothetical protein
LSFIDSAPVNLLACSAAEKNFVFLQTFGERKWRQQHFRISNFPAKTAVQK